ncbi:MAG: trypsin-like peptidase domain-containing protein [Ignavibacteriales bacterium]|nr:trypsin-like peptidase domain-containing protein [Ignavibacteriales bacterium]
MIRKLQIRILLVVPVIISILSCSSTSILDKVYPTLSDGKYDSEFPYKNSSQQLEEVSNSIRLINSIAFYESYVFDRYKNFTLLQLNQTDFEKNAVEKVYFNRTASGTGTIIFAHQGLVALLTVAHIVSFPDTVVSYFVNPDGISSQFVESISIKLKQTNYVSDFPESGELDVILKDKNMDVALLGKKYSPNETNNMTVFQYPWGNSTELEWGSFIYVFGFPMNYKMISKGIVSSPGKEKHIFLIDAVFNKGCSGGIVLAIRDGVPNFELVGIVKSVPAEFENTLRPLIKERDLEYNPMLPYKGDVYVDKEQVLRIGITKVIGIETVKDFLISKKNDLISMGYNFKDLFSPTNQTILKQIH